MKTASWFTRLPADHIMIGISRSTPRRIPAGYKIFRALAPGPWFNSVGVDEYYERYKTEILAKLSPRDAAEQIALKAEGRIPVLVCFEKPDTGDWCHRAMAAEWFAEALGQAVPEFGFETLPQHHHPLMPPSLRRPIPETLGPDLTPYIGRTATIEGEEHRVVGADPARPSKAIIAAGDRQFSTGIETLQRHFSE